MLRTTCPSFPMRMKALGVTGGLATLFAALAAPIEGPVVKPISRPPPTATLTLRKWRRDRSTPSRSTITRSQVISGHFLVVHRTLRRALDSLTDAHIGAAAADVP